MPQLQQQPGIGAYIVRFQSQAALLEALQQLGGGVRGKFRFDPAAITAYTPLMKAQAQGAKTAPLGHPGLQRVSYMCTVVSAKMLHHLFSPVQCIGPATRKTGTLRHILVPHRYRCWRCGQQCLQCSSSKRSNKATSGCCPNPAGDAACERPPAIPAGDNRAAC